jgi:hypothetical protein
MVRVILDYETGAARLDEEEEDASMPAALAVLAWIQEEVDSELLDALHARWSRARGDNPRRRVVPEPLLPGEPLAWSDVFPSAREDRYIVGDNVYLLEEFVYVDAGRARDEARLVVINVPDGRYGEAVGSWLVHGSTASAWAPESCSAETLQQIWAAYQRRHRAGEIAAHAAEVRAAVAQARSSAAVAEAPSARPRSFEEKAIVPTSRNGQCPCGSGKKFKKCCGA